MGSAELSLCLLLLTAAWRTEGFQGAWLDPDYYARTAVRPELQWDWGRTWSGVSINNQPVANLLSNVLGNYKYSLPRVALQRGVAYMGPACRLRRLVRQLLSRDQSRPVKVGVIGGSITWGQGVRPRGEADWFSLLSKWMLAAFPAANITTRNGCTPGVPASYMM
ncbi:hypothetical protein GPECTOR_983g252 [Gonium pectorale]|uniref:SGNH hydrolase-type esterase domain-containing protein n=1 Tax=Gonium pectorale TaxID=33097 RepID=A0A150FTR2_GONPE|nr:hypothetical protein GPECTOR_983g252 [Gonium pectorale]|eukprot:KXZ41011.1 hypothetical protein GPECTOR_983g252 [Gonium pectorale]